MPSARTKLLTISLLLVVILLLPTSHNQLLTVYAQGGNDCQIRQDREDGVYLCTGGIFGDECIYDPKLDLPCERISAATTTPNQQPTPSSNLTSGQGTPIHKGNYKAPQHANYTILNLEHTVFCELVGMSPVDTCIGLKKERSGQSSLFLFDQVPGGGAVGGLTTVMVAIYTNPPTSSVQYLADLGENLGLIKPAYAQVGGSGAGIIEPIKALWQVARNIAYLAFIIIFLVVGFMVMFRTRINPQVVISAQQALPGLVIGLILVTFSYFLAALLIDISFVAIQVVAQFFDLSRLTNFFTADSSASEVARDSNVFKLFTGSIRLPQNIGDIAGGIYQTMFSTGLVGTVALAAIPAVIGAIIGTLIAPGVGTLLGLGLGAGTAIGGGIGAVAGPAILGLIVPLILILALIIQFFRLLWQLISSYIALLVGTIAGPFIVLAASIPGKGGVLGLWWKSLLGNALVFPAVFAAFMFAGVILGLPTKAFNAAPPLFGGLSTELLRLILAYGIILGTPAIPGMVRRALGVPGPEAFAQEAIGGAAAGLGAAQLFGAPIGRGGINALYSRLTTRMTTGVAAPWERQLAQQIWRRWGTPVNQQRRNPWFTGNPP